jgi:hypothetical protein
VAQASDEWGADLVSVREDYQKKGLGLQLLTEFRRQFPKVRQMGQMSGAGRELAKSYYRSLTGNEPVPEYDPDEDPDYLARRAVWRFLANIDYAQTDLMTYEQAEKIKEFNKAGEKDKDPHALLQRVRDWVLQQGAGATFITPASKRALDPMAASGTKTAYISMKQAELTVIMDLGNQPRATITLDLGIPNFTVFSIRIPIDGIPIETIVGYVESAFEALLDDIAAFMLTMKYPEAEVVSIEEDARKCFHAINFKDASDADMSDKDAFIRMYEGHFELSPEFVDETQDKVVTAKVVKREPPVRRLELQRMDPNLRNNKPARIIQLYRNRSLRSQPRPHYVLVYDQRGRGMGAVPLARNWESRLLVR